MHNSGVLGEVFVFFGRLSEGMVKVEEDFKGLSLSLYRVLLAVYQSFLAVIRSALAVIIFGGSTERQQNTQINSTQTLFSGSIKLDIVVFV